MDRDLAEEFVSGLPDAKERRRYALLQAAAVLASNGNWGNVEGCVGEAMDLLAEIERRES